MLMSHFSDGLHKITFPFNDQILITIRFSQKKIDSMKVLPLLSDFCEFSCDFNDL